MTLEQLETIRGVRAEIDATRERILNGNLPYAEGRLEIERQLELTKKLEQLERAAEPQPPPPASAEIAKLPRAEAAKRAEAIRARPEYWKSDARDKDGNLVLPTKEKHEALVRELQELDARAASDTE